MAAKGRRQGQPAYRSKSRQAKGDKLRWSHWAKLPGEQMLPFLRDQVFHFLRNLGAETSSFTQYMQDAVCIIPKASLLQEATQIIEGMHISEQNADVQGDIYEYLLNQLSSSGKNGQFRTPRHIIRMIAQMADPKLGERICDPAAGTAGFLVAAYEHILAQNTSPEISGSGQRRRLPQPHWRQDNRCSRAPLFKEQGHLRFRQRHNHGAHRGYEPYAPRH